MSLLLKSFSVKEGQGLQQRRTQSKGTVSSEWLKSFLFSSFNRALVSLLPSLWAVHYLHAFSFTHSAVLVWLHDKAFSYRVLNLKFSRQQSGAESTRVPPNSNTNQPRGRRAGKVQRKEPTGHTSSHVHTPLAEHPSSQRWDLPTGLHPNPQNCHVGSFSTEWLGSRHTEHTR